MEYKVKVIGKREGEVKESVNISPMVKVGDIVILKDIEDQRTIKAKVKQVQGPKYPFASQVAIIQEIGGKEEISKIWSQLSEYNLVIEGSDYNITL